MAKILGRYTGLWQCSRATITRKNLFIRYYNARGITVCDRWKDVSKFFLDMAGEPPNGTSLDRVNVNGKYEPANCRWATSTGQPRNKRDHLLTYKGIIKLLMD